MKTFFNRNSKAYGENKDLFKYFLLKADYDSNGDGYIDITKLKSPSNTSYVKLTDNALLSVQLDRIDYLINDLQDRVALLSGDTVEGIPYLNAPNEFEDINIFADDVTVNGAFVVNETSTFNSVSTFNADVNIDADIETQSISFNKDESWGTDSQLTGKTVHENSIEEALITLGTVPGIYHITFTSGVNLFSTDASQPVYLLLSVGASNIEPIIEHKVDMIVAYNVSTGANYCIYWDDGAVVMKDVGGETYGLNVLIQQTYLTF
jgi:hypothetical protein